MALFSGVFPFKVAFSNARDAFKGDNWNNSSDNVQLNASTMEAIKDDCENFFFFLYIETLRVENVMEEMKFSPAPAKLC